MFFKKFLQRCKSVAVYAVKIFRLTEDSRETHRCLSETIKGDRACWWQAKFKLKGHMLSVTPSMSHSLKYICQTHEHTTHPSIFPNMSFLRAYPVLRTAPPKGIKPAFDPPAVLSSQSASLRASRPTAVYINTAISLIRASYERLLNNISLSMSVQMIWKYVGSNVIKQAIWISLNVMIISQEVGGIFLFSTSYKFLYPCHLMGVLTKSGWFVTQNCCYIWDCAEFLSEVVVCSVLSCRLGCFLGLHNGEVE